MSQHFEIKSSSAFNTDIFNKIVVEEPKGCFKFLRKIIKYISLSRQSSESSRLGNFIVILLLISSVSLIHGIQNQNFEYISEAFYEFLHLFSYCFSLFALIKAKHSKNDLFTFGYNRYETIAAFSNCIYLILSSLFLVMTSFHSLHELAHAQDMHVNNQATSHTHETEIITLFYVQLLYSIAGVFSFADYALFIIVKDIKNQYSFHGVTDAQFQNFNSGYQQLNNQIHNENNNNNSNGSIINGQQESDDEKYQKNLLKFSSHYENMHSVFLHFLVVLILNLGKVTAFHLSNYFAYIEILISIFTLFVTIIFCKNLLITTSKILLNAMPIEDAKTINDLLKKILYINGVIDIEKKHFWALSSSFLVCQLSLRIKKDSNQDLIYDEIKQLIGNKFQEINVQFDYQK